MTYHAEVALPDGRTACADHRDPIAKVMNRIHRAIMDAGPGKLAGMPQDYALVTAWLDGHEEQSALCRKHLLPGGPDCGHD